MWRYYGNCRTTVRHHRLSRSRARNSAIHNNPRKAIFLKTLVFGATLAIAIGPIGLLIIDHAARGGLRMGLSSALGAASGDLTYALVALAAGVRVLPVLCSKVPGFTSERTWSSSGSASGSLLIQVGIAFGGTVLKHVISSRGVRALNVLSAGGIVAFGFIDLLR